MAVYGTFEPHDQVTNEPLVQRSHAYSKCSNQIYCCKYLKFGWYLQLKECSMTRQSERIQIYSQSNQTLLTDSLVSPLTTLTNSLLRVFELTTNKFVVHICSYFSKQEC